MEDQTQYERSITASDKRKETTITFTQLAKYVLQVYCMPKIMRDVDKPDPMTEDMLNLNHMWYEENLEAILAEVDWTSSKTELNANKLLEEYADQINIILFKAGQVAGYKSMTRE